MAMTNMVNVGIVVIFTVHVHDKIKKIRFIIYLFIYNKCQVVNI